MTKPPVSEQVQVNFRMPVDLRDRIKAAAEANNRSMNAEIVATLEEKYPSLRRGFELSDIVKLGQLIKSAKSRAEADELVERINREIVDDGGQFAFTIKSGTVPSEWIVEIGVA